MGTEEKVLAHQYDTENCFSGKHIDPERPVSMLSPLSRAFCLAEGCLPYDTNNDEGNDYHCDRRMLSTYLRKRFYC